MAALLALTLTLTLAGAVQAAGPGALPSEPGRLLEGAQSEAGKALHAKNNCAACHQQRSSLDEAAYYRRPGRKIASREKLIAQVETCDTTLQLGLFPEEVRDIAAYLNTTHYRLD